MLGYNKKPLSMDLAEEYHSMVGIEVIRKFSNYRGLIINKPSDAEFINAYEKNIFLEMEDGEILCLEPSTFVDRFEISVGTEFSGLTDFLNINITSESNLDRFCARQHLKK